MALKDALCRNAIPEPGKTVRKLTDEGTGNGALQLWIVPPKPKKGRPRKDAPRGAAAFIRRWVLDYRHNGARKRLTLGTFMDGRTARVVMPLSEAREKADDLRRLLRDGKDPAAVKEAAKVAVGNTFGLIADEWLAAQKPLVTEDTHDKQVWLVSLARSALGARPIAEITAAECLTVLKRLHARSNYDTVRRLRAVMSNIFRLAMSDGRASSDPADALRGHVALKSPQTREKTAGKGSGSFAAILEPEAFGALLRDVAGYHGQKETRLALQLLTLTWLRPVELRKLRWGWVGENAGEPAITLPASLMKMRREHRVPLSRQAVAIIGELREMNSATGPDDFVFPCSQPRRRVGKRGKPSKRPTVRPLSEGALGSALKRLGYSGEQHTPHGFRQSGSTISNEAGEFEPHVIDAALSHVTSGVEGDYNKATYWRQRVPLAQWWADRVDAMREPRAAETTSNVVGLRRA